MRLSGSVEDRFWPRVNVAGPDECWEWTGAMSGGYGMLRTVGRSDRAHRVSWRLANDAEIPPGMCVCHRCDNPPCCNPDHLFLGTKADNNLDKKLKGRAASQHGSANSNARLSDVDVATIRALYGSGKYSQREIGERFGVHQVHVSRLCRYKVRTAVA